jgi:hypothetical protein
MLGIFQLTPTSLSRASQSQISSPTVSLLKLLPATVSSCAMAAGADGSCNIIRGAAAVCKRESALGAVDTCLEMFTYVDESELVLFFGLVAGAATSEVVLIGEFALPEEAVVVILLCGRGGVADAAISGAVLAWRVVLPEEAFEVILV